MADDIKCDSLLKSTLETLGFPVERLFYSGNADTYFTYQLVNGKGTDFSDDSNDSEEYLYRVDLYSRTDYIALLRKTVKVVKEVGFYGITIDPEVHEKDTGYFHVPIEIKYLEV